MRWVTQNMTPNPDTAKIDAARCVANQVGVVGFLPEFVLLGGGIVTGLLRFHETTYNSSIKSANVGNQVLIKPSRLLVHPFGVEPKTF